VKRWSFAFSRRLGEKRTQLSFKTMTWNDMKLAIMEDPQFRRGL
jgi:hypothetical protein